MALQHGLVQRLLPTLPQDQLCVVFPNGSSRATSRSHAAGFTNMLDSGLCNAKYVPVGGSMALPQTTPPLRVGMDPRWADCD